MNRTIVPPLSTLAGLANQSGESTKTPQVSRPSKVTPEKE